MKIRKAVIPAAGRGTRFLPATKEIPKEMIPLLDRPMIHYVMEELVDSGIEEVILVTAEGKESIQKYFQKNDELEKFLFKNNRTDLLKKIQVFNDRVKVKSVIQNEQLGLGHAVLCSEVEIQNEPFVVILPDDLVFAENPCTKQLIQIFKEHDADAVIGVMEVPLSDTDKYGIVEGQVISLDKKTYKMNRMIEKPRPDLAPSNLATPGRYVFGPDIFKILRRLKPGQGGEIQLTDGISELAQEKKVLAFIFEGQRYDIGQLPGYLLATLSRALQSYELAPIIDRYLNDLGYTRI